MIATSEFKRGAKIEIEGEPLEILEYEHVKPGKGGAFVRTRLKNLKTGNVVEKTFRAGVKVKEANVEEKRMTYLYKEKDIFHFMDSSTFEDVIIPEEIIGSNVGFLQENEEVNVILHNESPINITLPNFVELKIIKTEPGIKGDTAAGATKPATLQTGAVVQVPLFIKEDDVIKIDTRTKEYIERVNT